MASDETLSNTENNEVLTSTETLTAQEVLNAGEVLVQHFGVDADPYAEPEQFLDAIKQINPRYKGDRYLVRRHKLEKDQTLWPPETVNLVMRTAEAMSMLKEETPLSGQYDIVVALGGARMANLDRVRYASRAHREGQAYIEHMFAAGSTRPFEPEEQEIVRDYAPIAETESDALDAAARLSDYENPGLYVEVFKIDHELGNGKRAGASDVLRALFFKLRADGILKPDSKVAAVTTQIYQVSTQLDLARVAKEFGVSNTSTAGHPSDPKIVEARTTATYLSEVLRTLKAAVNSVQSEK